MFKRHFKNWISLVVQWLRLRVPNAGGSGLIPGGGTSSHRPQQRVRMPQLKILHATTKILLATTKARCSQINKLIKKKLCKNIHILNAPQSCESLARFSLSISRLSQ